MRKTMNIRFDSYDMIARFSKDIADAKGEFRKTSCGCKIISRHLQSGPLQTFDIGGSYG